MTEGSAVGPVLNPLMQTWLDDVSNLLNQLNEAGAKLEEKEGYFPPEVVAGLRSELERLNGELTAKQTEITGHQNAEKILRNSISALQQELTEMTTDRNRLRDDLEIADRERQKAVSDLAGRDAKMADELRRRDEDFAEKNRVRDEEVANIRSTARTLRVEMAKERLEADARAENRLRAEHALNIARTHQIGKDKGIAVTVAYIEAAKEEGADLARASQLASSVVIGSAQRIESVLSDNSVTDSAADAVNSSSGSAIGSIKMRNPDEVEQKEEAPRNFFKFSRKIN